MRPDPLVGRVVAGRFLIRDVLRRGGLTATYLASDLATSRQVDVKVPLRPDLEPFIENEARLCRHFDQPCLPSVVAHGDDEGLPYLALEHQPGVDLGQLMRSDEAPDTPGIVDLTIEIAAALGAAHAHGVFHLDIKPSTLLVASEDGSGLSVQLTNLEIGRHRNDAEAPANEIVGTPAYMPPERWAAKAGDERSDIYSLGCVVYKLLTGTTPFKVDQTLMRKHREQTPISPAARVSDVDPGFAEVVLRCLAKRPADRFPDTESLIRAIRVLSVTSHEEERISAARARQPDARGRSVQPAPSSISRLDRIGALQAGGLGFAAGLTGLGLLAAPGWTRLAVGAGVLSGAALLALSAGWVERLRVASPEPAAEPAAVPEAEEPAAPWPLPVATPRPPSVAPPVVGAPDLLDMVELPPGRFTMGSPDSDDMEYDDEKPAFEVELHGTRWMQRCPVTNAEYRRVAPDHAPGEPDDLPVTGVSWFDAVRFCNAVSEATGFEPAYRIDGNTVTWLDANGYRLPTESEWEHACRAGTTTRYSFGNDPADLDAYAWYYDNSSYRKHAVGLKLANPFGLHDMHGNVWEWCWSDNGRYPRGRVEASHDNRGVRVLRGGAFDHGARSLRSASRNGNQPSVRRGYIGFRCVRGPRPER